jgi:mono/diheme cytochrome c family protein
VGALRAAVLAAVSLVAVLAASGCRQDMHNQPKYKPLRESTFFADGRASRPIVEGTVARGDVADGPTVTGRIAGGAFLPRLQAPMTAEMLAHGRERFDVFCSVCHDRAGTGNGMIVQRGFRRPPSLHDARLRQAADGYLFDVITNGFGVMPPYAAQVPVDDRWAIVAYVRALQLSQHAQLADVPADARPQLEQEAH